MIPSLPIEILREIILFSLPPLKQTNYGERYNLLLAYSLVDEVWKIIAQEELIKHLDISVSTRGAEKVKKINMELSRREESGLIPKVISIRLFCPPAYYLNSNNILKTSINTLFTKLVEVEEIWIEGFDFGMMAATKLIDWKAFTRLKKLHFIGTSLHDSLQSVDLTCFYSPTLTHLTLMLIKNYHDESLFDILLQTSIFPSLTSFAYVTDLEEEDEEAIKGIPQSIATQLNKLLIYDLTGYSEDALIPHLSKLSNLESLSLRDVLSLDNHFIIPSSLHNLSIARIHRSFVEKATILKNWIQVVDRQQQLQSIYFPMSSQMNLEDEEAFKDLTKFTSERGIKITYSKYERVNEINRRELFDFALK